MNSKRILGFGILGVIVLGVIFFVNLNMGSVNIPFSETFKIIFQHSSENESWQYIIRDYRLPKAWVAVLVGSGLGLSGLFMQTLFQNPLAGPYVLGLSSGASLGVAILVMGGGLLGASASGLLLSHWGVPIAASLGSIVVMLVLVIAAFRVKSTMEILIIGIMFAALTGALVTVLSYFSSSRLLQRFVFWTFGSLGNLSKSEIRVLSLFWLAGIGIGIFCLKNLNALLLGETYAKSMGVHILRNRWLVILSTSLITGSITAFAGPIAFVGLAVPHLIRLLFSTNNHLILAPAVLLGGALLMLICDSIAQLPGSQHILPINAVTSFFGAPIVIWLLLKRKKLNF